MNKTTIALLLFFVIIAIIGTMARSHRTQPINNTKNIETARPNPTEKIVSQVTLQTKYSTNSWFSSAYLFPSYPLFSYPGAFKIYEKGLGISVPQVKVTENTIFGSYDEMCTFNSGSVVSKSRVIGYGDWNVEIGMTGSEGEYRVRLVQGMPQTYIDEIAELHISCPGSIVTQRDNGVSFKRGESILFVQGNGEARIEESESEVKIISPKREYRISVIPHESDDQFIKFSSSRWNRVLSTNAHYTVLDKAVETTFTFTSEHSDPILTTIWPHQTRVSGVDYVESSTYSSVIGPLKLASTSEFKTSTVRPSLSIQFERVKNSHDQKIIMQEISKDARRLLLEQPPAGVYFKGTWLGSLTTLVQLADLYGMVDVRDGLLTKLDNELAVSRNEFTYDQEHTMYVSKKPEFGNEFGNDHHFHYGYYIRAAAILGSYRTDSIATNSAFISEMIQDIATESDISQRYPRLRSYSVYDGHSWADGVGKFADGNDQESTSESLNAWYAVWLWGNITKDATIKNTGEWLFSQELTGTQAYWFGKGNPFPEGYKHPVASLVWGGKRDFSTWFSGHALHIYGIQFLPITPASRYLQQVSEGLIIESDVRSARIPMNHEWADLYLAYLSYFDPEQANLLKNQVQGSGGLKLGSLFYQTLYSNMQE